MFFWIYKRVNMNIIIEQLCIKLGPPKPKPAPSFEDGKLDNVKTIGNHPRFENIHPWDTICCYFRCHAKQCCGSQLLNVAWMSMVTKC